MSAIMEYLKLIPTVIENKEKIIEGIANNIKSNFGTLPEDEQKEIARRQLICKECPFNSSNAVSNPALNYKSNRFDEHCIHCGCNIQLKTSSLLSNCGIEIYNANHPDKQIPLRWEAYEKNQ